MPSSLRPRTNLSRNSPRIQKPGHNGRAFLLCRSSPALFRLAGLRRQRSDQISPYKNGLKPAGAMRARAGVILDVRLGECWLPLSNPPEMINLGLDRRAGIRTVCGSSFGACSQPMPGPYFSMPIQPLGRTGSGDLESVAGSSAIKLRRSRGTCLTLSGCPWDFERLSHVAVNFQSLVVQVDLIQVGLIQVGLISRFCSPDEQ